MYDSSMLQSTCILKSLRWISKGNYVSSTSRPSNPTPRSTTCLHVPGLLQCLPNIPYKPFSCRSLKKPVAKAGAKAAAAKAAAAKAASKTSPKRKRTGKGKTESDSAAKQKAAKK